MRCSGLAEVLEKTPIIHTIYFKQFLKVQIMTQISKTRFAPSPTGLIHLGNVRTALFNWLCAISDQGVFLLRIEDTDKERSKNEYVEALKHDLKWLGLEWQEGPDSGGDAGPYNQSERVSIYNKYYALLIEKDNAYPCFCSPQELSLSRKVQRSAGKPPRYAGTCASLSKQEVEKKKQQGLQATLRFRVAKQGQLEFNDLVRGAQRFACNDIGDFIIRRSDDSPSFFFSNAIDDALMDVSLILRGEDHLTNTPRQIMILEALGLRVPAYGHISLIVGDDGTPLSKRHGSMSVQELKGAGFLPLAVVNYLARLGHHYPNEAYMSMQQLAQEFSTKQLGKAPARYQKSQLIYWQHEAIMNTSDQDLWLWMKNVKKDGLALHQVISDDNAMIFSHAIRENVTMPEDGLNWAANLFSQSGLYDEKAKNIIVEAGADFFSSALEVLNENHDQFKSFSNALSQKISRKGKQLFMPLRAAMTGELHADGWHTDWMRGPQMAALWKLLGTELIKRRLELAVRM